MSTIKLTINQGTATLSGALTRQSVPSLGKNSHIKLVKGQQTVELDLSNVTKVDTAGLAWLLLALEQANKAQCQLSFAHVPADLLKLAQLSAVDTLLLK